MSCAGMCLGEMSGPKREQQARMGRQSGVLSSLHSLRFLCPAFSVCRWVLMAIGIRESPLPPPQGHRWPMLVSCVLGQEGRVSASRSCSRPYHQNPTEHSLTIQPLLHPDATSHQVGNSLSWQSYYCNPINKNTNFSERGLGGWVGDIKVLQIQGGSDQLPCMPIQGLGP